MKLPQNIIEKVIIAILAVLIGLNMFTGVKLPQIDQSGLNDIKNERDSLLILNQHLDSNIKHFQNEILHNDSLVDNANVKQLDSLFSNYLNR